MTTASLRRILALIKKEFILTWLDPKSRGMIIFMPLMQLFIFGQTVTMEVKNIDLAVLDRDRTVESRELISRFEASTHFRHLYYFEDTVTFQNKIDVQEVQLGLEINDGFGAKLRARKPTEVLIIADGRSTNTAALAGSYAGLIIADYSKDITPKTATQKTPAINLVTRHWFNPNLDYQWFILPIIACNLSVVMSLILTSLSIARERELGTFDQLIVSPLSAAEIMIGKTIPPLSIAVTLTMIMCTAVNLIYGVPLMGSPWLLLLSTSTALLAMTGVGLFISSICKTQQQAVLSVMTFMSPIVLTAGYLSPIEDMPLFLQYLTYANPMRWYVANSKAIFLKDLPAGMVIHNCIPLLIISAATLTLAAWTFKRKKE